MHADLSDSLVWIAGILFLGFSGITGFFVLGLQAFHIVLPMIRKASHEFSEAAKDS